MKPLKHMAVAFILLQLTGANAAALNDGDKGKIAFAMSAMMASTLVTYCTTKHGPVYGDAPGGKCFKRGKETLAKYTDLQHSIKTTAERCPESEKLNTCITPEIFNVSIAITAILDKYVQ